MVLQHLDRAGQRRRRDLALLEMREQFGLCDRRFVAEHAWDVAAHESPATVAGFGARAGGNMAVGKAGASAVVRYLHEVRLEFIKGPIGQPIGPNERQTQAAERYSPQPRHVVTS